MKEEKNCKAWRVPPTPSSHTHACTHTHKLSPPTLSSRGHPSSKEKNYKGGGVSQSMRKAKSSLQPEIHRCAAAAAAASSSSSRRPA